MKLRAAYGLLCAALIISGDAMAWDPQGASGWGLFSQVCVVNSNSVPNEINNCKYFYPNGYCAASGQYGTSSCGSYPENSIWVHTGSTPCPSGFTWNSTANTCNAQPFNQCVAAGNTWQECDALAPGSGPNLIKDFPPDLDTAKVCSLKNGVPYCFTSGEWPTGCGEINGNWTCVQPLDPAGINFGSAGTPPQTVNDANGKPLASDPKPNAANYSTTNNTFQGSYSYSGPGASTGAGTSGTGTGQGQIDTTGLAQDSTLQQVLTNTGEIETALDGTADTSPLEPNAKTSGIQGVLDSLNSSIGTFAGNEGDFLTSVFPLPTAATCTPFSQTVGLSTVNLTWNLDACSDLALFREIVGYLLYVLTFLYIASLVLRARH